MLGIVLDTGGFPRPPGGGAGSGGAWETNALTDGMKEKVEKAFAWTLQAGNHKALRPLFAYVGDSRRKASAAAAAAADGGKPQPYWTGLSDETLDALNSALWDFAGHDDDQHLAAFGSVYDVYLDPDSRFATPAAQECKAEILDEAFFWAAQHGCVRMMRLIAPRHERLDVNHLSRRLEPYFTTAPLRGRRLGPRRRRRAPPRGTRGAARRPRGRGPIRERHYRARDLSEDAWRRERGGDGLQGEKGTTWDEERNEVHYVVLRLEEADAAWWSRPQIRKNDEELAAMEKDREVSNGTPRPINTRN
ncbi:hypothetical protein DL769_004345 [Monosporascus sp. CRB-8-3]|nr:hypothetical protein DL769_004345 [Monosporascus sp. CRB-8-3]